MKRTPEEIFDIAIKNSYMVLFEDADEEKIMNSKEYYFAHNPFSPYSKKLIQTMLEHFIALEDYEKCSVLKQELSEWNLDNIRRRL
jgi:hypothetical protein